MKKSGVKIYIAVFILPLFILFSSVLSLWGQENATRGLTEEMQSGEAGTEGSGSPPGPFGDHWVHLNNNVQVDSYDSREAPYDPENPGQNANIGSNCDGASGGVSLSNNADVYGNISVTTSEEEGNISIATGCDVTGSINYNASEWEFLPIDMPTWYTTAAGGPNGQIDGTYGSRPGSYEVTNHDLIAYNNANITFHAGEYHFDNFEMSNNTNFNVDENIGEDELVEIYVNTSIQFENNSETLPAILLTGDTTKLRFYFNGTEPVNLSNNVTFYGFIYAPNAMIEVKNNGDIYGNLVGKEVYIWNNGAVHYDEALQDMDFGNIFVGGTPAQPHERTDWKEIIVTE